MKRLVWAMLAMAACTEDVQPCRDEVFEAGHWWSQSACSHSQHELVQIEGKTWTCRCKKAAK